MHGEATPKRRATSSSDTMEVRAHSAHLDDADSVCTCCADQPSKRVQWLDGPWDVLRTITATRETRQPLRTKAGNAINRSVLDALSMPYRRASRTRTRPSPRTTAPVVADMCQPGSVQQQRLPSHRPRGSKLRGSQLRGSTFRGKRRQHGAPCPLGTARLSARPQESSNNMWHRTTNCTSTGRSWDNRLSE